MKKLHFRQLLALLLFCFPLLAWSSDLWYEDNNLGKAAGMPADFVEKFYQPESFERASQYINVYMVRGNVLAGMQDDFLKEVFAKYLTRHNMKLALDVGGANWLQLGGRKKVFEEDMALLRRLANLGIEVEYIGLQSVLSKAPRIGGVKQDYPLSKRLTDIVEYAKAVRAIMPNAKIGLIDALPSHGEEYREPYRRVKEALTAEGINLAFIHLDISLQIPMERRDGVTWQKLLDLERYVENDLGIKFGYFMTSQKGGRKSSKAYHEDVLKAFDCYAGIGGTPADFIVASWFPYPDKTIPDNPPANQYTAMRTVLEVGKKLTCVEGVEARHGLLQECGLDDHALSRCNID